MTPKYIHHIQNPITTLHLFLLDLQHGNTELEHSRATVKELTARIKFHRRGNTSNTIFYTRPRGEEGKILSMLIDKYLDTLKAPYTFWTNGLSEDDYKKHVAYVEGTVVYSEALAKAAQGDVYILTQKGVDALVKPEEYSLCKIYWYDHELPLLKRNKKVKCIYQVWAESTGDFQTELIWCGNEGCCRPERGSSRLSLLLRCCAG
jgi:hypothetical protein